MRHDGWKEARPVIEYFRETRRPLWGSGLKLIESEMAAYGDWNLYQDEDGNYWEEYFSIGD